MLDQESPQLCRHLLCLLSATTLIPGTHASGHNGAIALVYPIDAITVDGDIADWPSGLPVYPINQVAGGDTPQDTADFSAQFRIGYSVEEGAIFFALEVADDSAVIESAAPLDNKDSCVLFIAETHEPGTSAVLMMDIGELASNNLQRRRAAMKETTNGRVYEWRIDSKEHVRENRTIGMDLGLCDYDQDGSRTLTTWGTGGMDKSNGHALGDAILLSTTASLGTINGSVRWQGAETTGKGAFPKVMIRSLEASELWIQTNSDASGRFSATLPTGDYEVSPVDSIDLRVGATKAVRVVAVADRNTRADVLQLTPPSEPELIGDQGLLHNAVVDPQQIDRFLHAYLQYYKVPGISIAIIKDGDVVYHRGLGLKNTETGGDVTDSTVFEAASMTKPMFAFAVNRLIEQQILDLDTPLHEYLPYSDIAHDERYKSITTRMVLSHRSGFPNWRKGQLELMFEPGTRFSYSGEGFKYLGDVVSHLTNKDLTGIFRDEVFAPLGIENAYLTWTDKSDSSLAATGHRGSRPLPKRMWPEPSTAASLHIDAYNYARFLAAILHRDGLDKATYDEMLRRQSEGQSPDSEVYALGMIVKNTPYGLRYSHGGRNEGFTSEFAIYDDNKFGYVFIVNNEQAVAIHTALEAFLITGKRNSTTR